MSPCETGNGHCTCGQNKFRSETLQLLKKACSFSSALSGEEVWRPGSPHGLTDLHGQILRSNQTASKHCTEQAVPPSHEGHQHDWRVCAVLEEMSLLSLDEREPSHFATFELPITSGLEVVDTRKQRKYLCTSCRLEDLESIAAIEQRLLTNRQ